MKRYSRHWLLVPLSLIVGLPLAVRLCAPATQVRTRAQPEPPVQASSSPRAAAPAPPAPAPKVLPPEPRHAVLVGSSSIRGALGDIITDELERRGFQVTRQGIVSAGLARPDYRDLRRVVDELPIGEHTAAVFIYVGMNDGQAIWLRPSERRAPDEPWLEWDDPRWPEVYRRRARGLFSVFCARGAQQAIVMLPVEVAKPRLEHKMRRIRRLQRQAARGVRCASAVSTAGDRGNFFDAGEPLRLRDGFHMSERGARLVWQRVRERAPELTPLLRAL